ncbi:type II secretion system secretin GspD [Jeongeupia naejangsanensis]|uniref:Type II secretion system secretin GspD n=2 Tax=Jeongeupia naejangsanensis TaxID=613195 RepID=A0ABS2BK92_9NEIS|nr:type II secretion system secretin GspD [Jeongeupia naejangsanensis]
MLRASRRLLLASLLAAHVHAADNKVTLNFVNADIESTVKAVGLITGKNFLIDPRVKGTINIVSAQPVDKDSVYPVLLSALRQQGFTAVESGKLVKVMPEADAKTNSGPTESRELRAAGDRIVTQVYPLKFESANQVLPILRPLVSANNAISVYAPSNTLVITDYADNIRRLNRIIQSIDQPAQSDIFPVQLKYASAVDVSQMLSRLMPELNAQGAMAGATPVDGARRSSVVPDVRSNTLLVRSENAVHAQQIRRLVETLDQPGAAGGNIHVVYLRNAEAVKLAATLKGVLTGQDSGGAGQTGSTSASSLSSNNTSGGMSLPPTSAPTTATGSSAASVQIGGATVLLQADPMTNALIITAPDNVYNNLRSVIDKLDVRRAQVYVEAMIAEVNASKVGEFGVQWLLGGGGDNVSGVGISALGLLSNGLGNLISGIVNKDPNAIPGGLTVGVVNGNPFKEGGKTPTLGILASALQNTGDANILSTPNLITLDNEEARIMVGQNIPIITGTQSSTGSNPNPFTTVERKDIGIALRVKPQVSEGGSITLSVYQEVSSIDNTVNTNGAGIATKKRALESKVLVDDGQVVVLGGLIQDQLDNSVNKVPGLGDVPGLGNLFKYQSRNWGKVNLMIFLRPVILRDGAASDTLSTDRYQYLRNEQAKFGFDSHPFLPDLPKVVLPELPAPAPVKAEPSAKSEQGTAQP